MKEEIFDEFIKRLENKRVPPALIEELKSLLKNNQLQTKESILDAIAETV